MILKLRPRTIFHCAGTRPDASSKECKSTNVLGTEVLLRVAAESRCVEAVIYAGSHAAIQLPLRGTKLTEDAAKLRTSTAFQKSKAKAEALVLAANMPSFKTTILRFPTVYGEDDPYCIPVFLELMRQNKTNVQIGPNTALFEWLFITNAVSAFLLASRALLLGRKGVAGESFFITDGKAIPFYDFGRKVWLNAGERLEKNDIRKVGRGLVMTTARVNDWIVGTATLGMVRPDVRVEDVRRLDEGFEWSIEKAGRLLRYQPLVGVDEGVKRSVRAALMTPDWRGLELRGRPAP